MNPKLKSLMDMEKGTYRAFYRMIFQGKKRKLGKAAGRLFGYSENATMTFGLFLFGSILETVALALIVKNPFWNLLLLILGVWGIVLILGLICANFTFLHEVTDSSLHVRSAAMYDIQIPLTAIASVNISRNRNESKVRCEGQRLIIPVVSETNVIVKLNETLHRELPWGKRADFNEIEFYCDDMQGQAQQLDRLLMNQVATQ